MRNFYQLENAVSVVGIMNLKNVSDVVQWLILMILKMDYVRLVQPMYKKSKVIRLYCRKRNQECVYYGRVIRCFQRNRLHQEVKV